MAEDQFSFREKYLPWLARNVVTAWKVFHFLFTAKFQFLLTPWTSANLKDCCGGGVLKRPDGNGGVGKIGF